MSCFSLRRSDACDPLCPGWVWSQSDQYGWSLQRCDECARFADDDLAEAHIHSCLCCAAVLARDLGLDCAAHDRARRAEVRAWDACRTPLQVSQSGPSILHTTIRRVGRTRSLARRARIVLRAHSTDHNNCNSTRGELS